MRKLPLKPFAALALVLLLLLSLPLQLEEQLRAYTVASLAPSWNRLTTLAVSRQVGGDRSVKETLFRDNRQPITVKERIDRLELENQLLKSQVNDLEELLLHEQLLAQSVSNDPNNKETTEALTRHRHEIKELQKLQVSSVPARVIFRSPDNWNSVLWLNVGEADNKTLGRQVIANNSPVVVGTALIGVVDLVNAHQCRVRLITDTSLTPSVRAVRGAIQRTTLTDHLDALITGLTIQTDLLNSPEQRQAIRLALSDLRSRLGNSSADLYLAKGELQGSYASLWRRDGSVLRGTGFNYDYPDSEGPARDLRTGLTLDGSAEAAGFPLLMVQDILVTTGMDGIFPAGLKVAEVTSIDVLREGDYFYELKAKPIVANLDTVSLVSVLPPLGFEHLPK